MNEIKLKIFLLKDFALFLLIGFMMLVMSINKIQVINIFIIVIFSCILIANIKYLIVFQLISVFATSFFIDSLWLGTHLDINLNIRYIADLFSVLLLYNIIMDRKKKNTDKSLIVVAMFLIFYACIEVIYRNNFMEFLNGVRLYFRFYVSYLAISRYNNLQFANKKIIEGIKYFAYLQMILVTIQSVTWPVSQDNFTGTFGINGTLYLSIFLSIFIFYYFSRYIIYKEKRSLIHIFLALLIFVLNETKIALVAIPIIFILIILIVKVNIIKQIKLIMLGAIIGISTINMLFLKYPEFKNMFTYEFIQSYIVGNNNSVNFDYSRVTSYEYINEQLLVSYSEKLTGKGLGSTFINDNINYIYDSKGRNINGIESSEFYNQNNRLGYEISSFTNAYLEVGILGLLLYGVLFYILLKRAVCLYKCKQREIKCIGLSGIAFMVYWMLCIMYGNVLFESKSNLIFWVFYGYISNFYFNLNIYRENFNDRTMEKRYE